MTLRSVLREAAAIFAAGIVLLLALALYSYHPNDPSFNHTGRLPVHNEVGIVGAYLADLLLQLFGFAAWLLIPLGAAFALRLALDRKPRAGGVSAIFWLPFLASLSGLLQAHTALVSAVPLAAPAGPGGGLGQLIANGLERFFHPVGTDILLLAVALSSLMAASRVSLVSVILRIRLGLAWLIKGLRRWAHNLAHRVKMRKTRLDAAQQRSHRPKKKTAPLTVTQAEAIRESAAARQPKLAFKEEGGAGFRLPDLSLFSSQKSKARTRDQESLKAMAHLLEKKLLDYRVEGRVTAVHPGPVVTQFEFEPAPGTKVSRIIALQDDLARAMSAVSVRVAGNIPGKSVIGIELPNEERQTVFLRDVLASEAFSSQKHILPLALGVDISGRPVVADLARMPHLLIAGTTGSGKSVSVNGMICSLLMTHTPQSLRLILVDPKMLELSMYEDIPHLLVPVVTDPRQAAKALAWSVYEMDRRYRLMAEAKVRNIEGYNRSSAAQEGERLPYIVIVIDELADLMMVAGREVEQSICRLAQKARAAGIHLILATQRPSVDVITGLIKANLPSRISFQVSSRVDSRTILDQIGAEQLLGHGDMLFLNAGRDLKRVHGAYVSESEVAALAEHLKAQGKPEYRKEVFEVDTQEEASGEEDELDPKFDEAVDLVARKGQVSVSMVQRYLRIGYNRAARIVERMEREGMVSPPGAGGIRKVLLRKADEEVQ